MILLKATLVGAALAASVSLALADEAPGALPSDMMQRDGGASPANTDHRPYQGIDEGSGPYDQGRSVYVPSPHGPVPVDTPNEVPMRDDR